VVYQGKTYRLKCFTSDQPYGKTKQYAEAPVGRTLATGEEIDPGYLRGFSGDRDVGRVTNNGREDNSVGNIV
jgi:hypothetical protein